MDSTSNAWAYIITGLLLVGSSLFSYRQTATTNEIIESGKVTTAVIAKMPDSFTPGSRSKNYCEIMIDNARILPLRINHTAYKKWNVGDSIQVRQKEGIDKVLLYDAAATTSNFVFEILLLCLGMLSLGIGIYQRKQDQLKG